MLLQFKTLLNRFSSAAFAVSRHSHSFSAGPVTTSLKQLISDSKIQKDSSQLSLAQNLDKLHQELKATDLSALSKDQLKVETELHHRSFSNLLEKVAAYSRKTIQNQWKKRSRPTPKGLYIHGSVGVGKTFVIQAVLRPAVAIPNVARKPAPPAPTITTSNSSFILPH